MLRRCASLASMGRPVRIMRLATFSPTILGRICVPPMPGINPRVISGRPNCAFSEQRMISQSRAASKPPPKAFPSTTAIIGLWYWRSLELYLRNSNDEGQEERSSFENSLMSAPALNIFSSLLRRRITLTDLSLLSSATVAEMFCSICWERALRSLGLLSQMVATSSLCSTSILGKGWLPMAYLINANRYIKSYLIKFRTKIALKQ